MKLKRLFYREYEIEGESVMGVEPTWLNEYIECWLEFIDSGISVITFMWLMPSLATCWARWTDWHFGYGSN